MKNLGRTSGTLHRANILYIYTGALMKDLTVEELMLPCQLKNQALMYRQPAGFSQQCSRKPFMMLNTAIAW